MTCVRGPRGVHIQMVPRQRELVLHIINTPGQAAGAGRPDAARHAVVVAMSSTLALIAVSAAGLAASRGWLARVFLPEVSSASEAHSTEARMALKDCLLLIAASMPGDWCNCTLNGALQGTGVTSVLDINMLCKCAVHSAGCCCSAAYLCHCSQMCWLGSTLRQKHEISFR
jgi:Na+-driven multidrug efflux pump